MLPKEGDYAAYDGVAAIGARGLVERHLRRWPIVRPCKRSDAKVFLQLANVLSPRLFPLGIFGEGLGANAQLLGYEAHHIDRRPFRQAERPAGKSQIGEVDGETQPVRVTTAAADEGQILGRQGVVANDGNRVWWRVEQNRTGLGRKNLVLLHGRRSRT